VTLEDLGNIGEIVGGVGVVVSLLYLATQIRQSSRIARLNAHQSIGESMSDLLAKLGSDHELRRIWQTARDTQEELSDDDRERLGMFLFQFFGRISIADRYAELDPSLGQRYDPILDRFLRVPAVQGWWGRQREYQSEPLKSKVDSRLRLLVQRESSPP
jgi:hypothetical protein